MKLTLRFILLVSAGCVSMGALPEPIDLGYGYDMNTIEFPGGEKFNYRKMFAGEDPNGLWYSSNDFATAEHCGTHLDAPYHFNKNGQKVGDIPLDRLITKGILVDAVKETGDNASYALPASKLVEWEKNNGEIPDKSVLLVRFGWSSRYPDRKRYLGPTDSDLRFPGLSEEAADWIVNSKKIIGVGVDSPSVDLANAIGVHVRLSAANIYNLENVNLRANLPAKFDLIVMPMKLANGTGAPTRIIAL